MTEDLLVEQRGDVLWLTINRPGRRNALTDAVLSALTDVFRRLHRDNAARAVVLTGAGDKAFCGGADLTPGDTPFKPNLREQNTVLMEMFRAADACRVPIVGRINGHCVAGGMGLLAMCDLAVAVDRATFALPEVKIGLYPVQVMLMLRGLMAPRHLHELALTGDRIDAATALSYGLVNRVAAPDALDATLDTLVAKIAANSPAAIRRGKYVMRAVRDMPFEAATAFLESQIPPMIMTDDAREGLASFNEKRPPRWSD